MSVKPKRQKSPDSARKSPVTGKETRSSFTTWEGRRIPLHREPSGIWRMRSRSKSLSIDCSLDTTDLTTAKTNARDELSKRGPVHRVTGTLADVIRVYKSIPKKCSRKAESTNVNSITRIAREAWGKAPEQVKVADIPAMFPAFTAVRQGLRQPDYHTRRRINITINSTMRQAQGLFVKRLHHEYRRAGVTLPPDVGAITWLPETQLIPEDADDTALQKAWADLRHENISMWVAVGLARFAGLRKNEIEQCLGSWIVKRGGAAAVLLMDRDDEAGRPTFRSKTGRIYYAVVINPELAAYLESLPKTARVIGDQNKEWMTRHVQSWIRPFTGAAKKPLHRLRGLYADQIKQEQEEAFLARQAGVRAASAALGHTNTKTTEEHYLSPE